MKKAEIEKTVDEEKEEEEEGKRATRKTRRLRRRRWRRRRREGGRGQGIHTGNEAEVRVTLKPKPLTILALPPAYSFLPSCLPSYHHLFFLPSFLLVFLSSFPVCFLSHSLSSCLFFFQSFFSLSLYFSLILTFLYLFVFRRRPSLLPSFPPSIHPFLRCVNYLPLPFSSFSPLS